MIWLLEQWMCIIQIKKSYCSFPLGPGWCPAAILSWESGRAWKRLCWDTLVLPVVLKLSQWMEIIALYVMDWKPQHFIVKALLKILELWSEMGNSIDPVIDSGNCGQSLCWVCGHSVRIEIEINSCWLGDNIHSGVQACSYSDIIVMLCFLWFMKQSSRSSLMGVRSEKVWKDELLWPSLCFCRHHSIVVQIVPGKVSDGRLGAWILISSFFKKLFLFHTQTWWHEAHSEMSPFPWCDSISGHCAAEPHTLIARFLLYLSCWILPGDKAHLSLSVVYGTWVAGNLLLERILWHLLHWENQQVP